MNADTLTVLEALFAPCEQGFFTFTAIHPDGRHPTPSRHVAVGDLACLARTLDRLSVANDQGWGAYVAVATRKANLGRWRRGGRDDLLALPALFADIDRPPEVVLREVRGFHPTPSCIVASGYGVHLYWLLSEPTSQFECAKAILRGLAAVLRGDGMSPAQSLRLPGTLNVKPQRVATRCEVIAWHPERRYRLDSFAGYAGPSGKTVFVPRSLHSKPDGHLNPRIVEALVAHFLAQGFKVRDTWLDGSCVYPERHQHADAHPSFSFNVASGYGFCRVCGTLRAMDLCRAVGVDLAEVHAQNARRSRL